MNIDSIMKELAEYIRMQAADRGHDRPRLDGGRADRARERRIFGGRNKGVPLLILLYILLQPILLLFDLAKLQK